MVGRMFREAVENLIDDVKDSIEEQGRSSGHHRQMQPRPPVPHLELPPDLQLRPAGPPVAGPSVTAAPVGTAPVGDAPASAPPPRPAATLPGGTSEISEPEDLTDDGGSDVEPTDHDDVHAVTPDDLTSDDSTAEERTPVAVAEPAEKVVARLEADCEAARELYRESRAELRQARRLARLAARDDRRNRRYERRLRTEIDDVP